MKDTFHEPVMLQECLDQLVIKEGGKYVDCTLGDGGHTIEILKKGGLVLGLDSSSKSLIRANARIKELGLEKNFKSVQTNFRYIEEVGLANGFGEVDGILYDLGFSSSQLVDNFGLSFFEKGTPLDMRLDESLGVTAADLVNTLPEAHLIQIFRDYAGENLAKRFAQAIVNARKTMKFQTTDDLVKVIVDAAPSNYERGRLHPATRVFLGLRIAVNDEFDNLKLSLNGASQLLLPGGRLVIMSYHSLEDRIVKQFYKSAEPNIRSLVDKPILPSDKEVKDNSRSRSAILRVFEKR